MKKYQKQEKAITLIALVITIIVLLILAGVSVATLTGENGILTKASKAKEETIKAEEIEALELIGLNLRMENIKNNLTKKEFMDLYEKELGNDERFKGSIITRKDDETIEIITKNDNIYEIKEDKVEFIGKQQGQEGETKPPDLQESDVTFKITPSEWTKNEVNVEITTQIEGYILQYSTDGTTWNNYTTTVSMTQNGAIYARLTNNSGVEGGYATANVANIDKLAPNQFIPTATSTTNTITLTGSTTDAVKTTTDGSSGIEKYYFSKDDGATWEPTAGQTTTNYVWNNLTQNQTYNLRMKAVDKAGNEVITEKISKATTGVPGLSTSNTTFSYSPSTWTKENVSVTISTTAGSGYTLQYSTDTSNWIDYTSAITMSDNGAIYARIKDSTGQAGGYATGNVTIIDRIPPTVSVSSRNITSNSAELVVTASDTQSGLATTGTYQYYLGTTLKSTSTSSSYNFTGLTSGTSYTLKVIVIDKAGNSAQQSTTVSIPKSVASLNTGDYVNYTDKKGITRTCRVLSTGNTPEILTQSSVEELTLKGGKTEYNNVISTLNEKANEYLNTTYASRARCVGSNPSNPNAEAGYFTDYNLGDWFSQYNGTVRNTDTNYESDLNTMQYSWGSSAIGTDYFLASRGAITGDSNRKYFSVRYINSNRVVSSQNLLGIDNPQGLGSFSATSGFRPVFKLKSEVKITGGSGTSGSPYTLGI